MLRSKLKSLQHTFRSGFSQKPETIGISYMKYVYEFIGTFFLVFTVAMTVLDPNSSGLLAPLAIGSVLAVMVFAGGHISGGHYNPAVSFSVFLRGKLSGRDLGFYWIAQLIGACIAALVTIYLKGGVGQTPLLPDVIKALVAEFIFTFALCYVVLNTAYSKETKGNSFYGFAIGFTVLVGAYAVGAISGGAFNPAVALGMTLVNLSIWTNYWIFIIANLSGAAVAALAFRAAHKSEL
jgi:aquaporin Z